MQCWMGFLTKKVMHRPGIEPGPPAWQASILPLNQRCCHTNSLSWETRHQTKIQPTRETDDEDQPLNSHGSTGQSSFGPNMWCFHKQRNSEGNFQCQIFRPKGSLIKNNGWKTPPITAEQYWIQGSLNSNGNTGQSSFGPKMWCFHQQCNIEGHNWGAQELSHVPQLFLLVHSICGAEKIVAQKRRCKSQSVFGTSPECLPSLTSRV